MWAVPWSRLVGSPVDCWRVVFRGIPKASIAWGLGWEISAVRGQSLPLTVAAPGKEIRPQALPPAGKARGASVCGRSCRGLRHLELQSRGPRGGRADLPPSLRLAKSFSEAKACLGRFCEGIARFRGSPWMALLHLSSGGLITIRGPTGRQVGYVREPRRGAASAPASRPEDRGARRRALEERVPPVNLMQASCFFWRPGETTRRIASEGSFFDSLEASVA